jgi:hypothetical protein
VYQYDYPAGMSGTGCSSGTCEIAYIQNDPTGGTDEYAVIRRVVARRSYPSGLSGPLEGQQCNTATYSPGTSVLVQYYGSDAQPGCASGTVISQEIYSFIGDPLSDVAPAPTWVEDATEGRETNTQWLEPDNTLRKTVSRLWKIDPNFQWQNAVECQSNNTTLGGASPATSGTFFLYDQYYNTTDNYEYDFGSAPAAKVKRPDAGETGGCLRGRRHE